MSQSPDNQTINISTSAQPVTSSKYYERIIVTNETSADIYVSTNGSPVAISQGNFGAVVLPGAWRMIGNDQPRQPLVTQSPGSTVQGAPNALASGHATNVSIIGAAGATGVVGVEFV